MVVFTLIFVLFGILMWVAAGVLLYFRRRQLRMIDLIGQVETSTASEVSRLAPGTLVEVKGTLRCESPLKSEMTEQACAYYLSRVIRRKFPLTLRSESPAPSISSRARGAEPPILLACRAPAHASPYRAGGRGVPRSEPPSPGLR